MSEFLNALDLPAEPAAEAPEPAPVAAEPAEAPAVEAPAAPEPPAPEARQAMVPHAALAESRETIRHLKAQIAELEKAPRLTREDQELLADLKARKAAEAAQPVPDFVQDPKGYVDARVGEALKKLEDTTKQVEDASKTASETREQVQQREQLQTLLTTAQTHEAEFVKSTPDYFDALKHMREMRFEQLQILHPEATNDQIMKQIQVDELRTAAIAINAGKNPAAEVYRMARTFGYRKVEAAAPSAPVAPVVDRDAARTLATPSAPDPEPEIGGGESSVPEFQAALSERFGRRRG